MPKKLSTFVHMSDTHWVPDPDHVAGVNTVAAREQLETLIERINTLEIEVDFVMHTGDIVDRPASIEDYVAVRELLANLRFPLHILPGNHDDPEMFQRGFLQRSDAELTPHCDERFDAGGVEVVLLDSVAPPDVEVEGSGFLAAEQLAWLDGICSSDDTRPLVIGTHHHVLPIGVGNLDAMRVLNGEAAHELFKGARHRLRGVFYGHIHESMVMVAEGVPYICVQSAWTQLHSAYGVERVTPDWSQAPGFNLVTVTSDRAYVRFRRL